MGAVMFPQECLNEEREFLAWLRGDTVPKTIEVEQCIREAEANIKSLEEHLAKHGNTWSICQECGQKV